MNIVNEDLKVLSNLLQIVSKKAKFLDMSLTDVADVYNAIFQASKLENKLKEIVNTPLKKPVEVKRTRKKVKKEIPNADK